METITTKKIHTHRGVILSAIKETNDTWTLNIFVGDKEHEYLAGQFISLSPYQFPELVDFARYCALIL
jgi:ferredoxin-NADP reductase